MTDEIPPVIVDGDAKTPMLTRRDQVAYLE
jgi:hypothetical protein